MENTKKKILIAAEIFPPDIGGPATYTREIADEFARQGFEVAVVCYGEPQTEDGKLNFSLTRISRKSFVLVRYFRYVYELWKQALRSDIMYAQGPIGSGIPTYLVGNLLGKKYAVKIVGDYAWESAKNAGVTDIGVDEFQTRKFPGKIGFLQYLESLVARNAAKVIVPSQYLKKIVRGWGVTEAKIEVVYNAFTPSPQLGRERDQNLIVSVGRLVPWKGFSTLIALMPELLKVNPKFQLQIAGFGPDLEALQNQIAELGLKNSVFVACVNHQHVLELMAQAGMFVLNTGYEGLSHTILEALAAKTPVITTNIGGNPELIHQGENGILIEYNNVAQLREAILRIYKEGELRERFAQASQRGLEKFSFETMIASTLRVLENL